MKYILAVDIGTSSMKTVLFDQSLHAVAEASVNYDTNYPAPRWAEQDPEQWWRALKEAVSKIFTSSDAPNPQQVQVIAIDAMAPTMLPVDRQGRALRNAILWLDRRAESQCILINEKLGDSTFSIGGNINDPSNFAPKVLWIKDNEPALYTQTHRFLSANGYLIHRLTGVDSIDATQCGLSQLYSNSAGNWSDTLIDGCGLHREKLPVIRECDDIVGTILPNVATEIGLSHHTEVIAGSMDNAAAVLGTGSMEDGTICISAGTASNVNLCMSKPHFSHSSLVYRHIVPNQWIHAGSVDYGGAGYKWFAELIGEDDYSALDARVANVDPRINPLFFIPYMMGQRAPLFNSYTRGVFFGLTPSTDAARVARSCMEGNVLGIRKVLQHIRGMRSLSSSACRLTGGCARSAVYAQIFADVLNIDILRIAQADTAVLGIAMAGARAAGFFPNFESMLPAVSISAQQRPDRSRVAFYNQAYKQFNRLYNTLEPEFEALAALNSSEEKQ